MVTERSDAQKQGLEGSLGFERVYLTRLTQVSKGSWQPELFCEDPVTPGLAA